MRSSAARFAYSRRSSRPRIVTASASATSALWARSTISRACASSIDRIIASARRAHAAVAVELGLGTAELGHGIVAVDPLAGDAMPVGGGAQLRQHSEREHLHPAPEQ